MSALFNVLVFFLSFFGSCFVHGNITEDVQILLDNMKEEYNAKISAVEKKFEGEISTLKNEIAAYKTILAANGIGFEDGSDIVEINDSNEETPKMKTASPIHTAGRKVRVSRRQAASRVQNKVAFFATRSIHNGHVGANQEVVFNRVITNIGSAYDNRHGIFVAPVSGTYVFFSTINADHTYSKFVINGIEISTFDNISSDSDSQMVIINLKAGDDVTVKNVYADKLFFGDNVCTFSGFLLYQDLE